MQIKWYVTLDLQVHAYDEDERGTEVGIPTTLCGIEKSRWARTYIVPSDDARCFRCLVIAKAESE